MQSCFLVVNKTTQVKEYLEHRSIVDVTAEYSSLQGIDVQRMGIIDVDKFVYIYYNTDDEDLSFRADLSVMRNLLASPFFQIGEAIFILVDCKNARLEDLIFSACRESRLPKEKIDIIHHAGTIMLSDISKYLTGSATGTETVSSYKSVYIKEADSEEKVRYANVNNGVDTIIPVLTDVYSIYKQRASFEATSSGRIITDKYNKPAVVFNFSEVTEPVTRRVRAILLSGSQFTEYTRGVDYLVQYMARIGSRVLVIDTTRAMQDNVILPNSQYLELSGFKSKIVPAEKVALSHCRFNQLSYILEFMGSVEGIDEYLFVVDKENFKSAQFILSALCESLVSIYVAHYMEDSLVEYLDIGAKADVLFLTKKLFERQFALQSYREILNGIPVIEFPTDESDASDFCDYVMGGVTDVRA